jgi:hypothetical protein
VLVKEDENDAAGDLGVDMRIILKWMSNGV